MLSSQHIAPNASDCEKEDPQIILYYHSTSWGVDCAVNESVLTVSNANVRVDMYMFWWNIVDVAYYNAFVHYAASYISKFHGK